jgi:pyruvate/2-oxoglutarate dehydrogenase complex dihydrolipoamide acyltransferase (E2) component
MSEATRVLVPLENVNDESVILKAWLIADGGTVAVGQPLAELETSKAAMEVVSPADGCVRYRTRPGEELRIGAVLCAIGETSELAAAALAESSPPDTAIKAAASGTAADVQTDGLRPVRFSQKALRLLQEHGIDPGTFAGRGLVKEQDVLDWIQDRPAADEQPSGSGDRFGPPPGPTIQAGAGPTYRRESIRPQKQYEIKILAAGLAGTIPCTITLLCPQLTSIGGALSRSTVAELGSGKVSRPPAPEIALVVYHAARLLREFQEFNAFYNQGSACYYNAVNIGVLTDEGHGIRPLVIRDAASRDRESIREELAALHAAYARGDLTAEQSGGATFTFLDLSGDGVAWFTPLLSAGQSASLGVGVPPGGTLSLSLTFDHQLAAPRRAAAFLGQLIARLAEVGAG